MKQIITFALAILILIPPTYLYAQDKAKTAPTMSHATAKGATYAKGANKGSAMRYSKPSFLPIAKKFKANNALTTEESSKTTDKIWEKYRTLASGQDPAPKAKTIPVKKVKKVNAPPKEEIAPTGIAGIIAQYQVNKQKRSKMRSLTIAKPAIEKKGETPTTENKK